MTSPTWAEADRPDGLTLADAAQWYGARGCRVFPLRPRGKEPLLPAWQDKATTDPDTIRAWWAKSPEANIGVLNGGPFDVIDLDGPDALATVRERLGDPLPPALGWVETPRPGGLHAWIPAQGPRRKSGVLLHVDYLGSGGYVVAPPSVGVRTDETGETSIACYRWVDAPNLNVDRPPDCSGWLGILEPSPSIAPGRAPAPLPPAQGTTHYGARALADETARASTAPQGRRNDELNKAAFRIGQLVPHEIDEAEALAALTEAGLACGLSPEETLTTVRSGLAKGQAHPRQPAERVDGGVRQAPPTWQAPAPEAVEPPPPEAPEPPEGDRGAASWASINLAQYLDGSYTTPEPELLPRTDGICLLYRGFTHSFHGESESGKSLLAQVESVRILASGGRVLFIDFESDPGSVSARLIEFGATPAQIADRFVYVRPEVKPDAGPAEAAAFRAHLHERFDLAVVDGVTDALALWGAETKDNDGITRWARSLPKAIADSTGAAVVLVDHVTKDADSRGRFAIGGQAKLAALTGAAYTVEVASPLGRGLRGVIALRVAKDRPGFVRGHSGPMRARDRTQETARVVIDSTASSPVVTIEPPRVGVAEGSGPWRPTAIMESVSRLLEDAPGPMGINAIEAATRGKADHKRQALAALVSGGYVEVADGPNRSRPHASVKPYRQADDPQSDRYQPPEVAGTHLSPEVEPQVPLGASPSIDGDTGRTHLSTSGTHRGRTGDAPRPCPECGEQLPPGRARHPACFRATEFAQ